MAPGAFLRVKYVKYVFPNATETPLNLDIKAKKPTLNNLL